MSMVLRLDTLSQVIPRYFQPLHLIHQLLQALPGVLASEFLAQVINMFSPSSKIYNSMALIDLSSLMPNDIMSFYFYFPGLGILPKIFQGESKMKACDWLVCPSLVEGPLHH